MRGTKEAQREGKGGFRGSAARKGVRRLAGYFMRYYTIWLAVVKSYFVPFWELETGRGETYA